MYIYNIFFTIYELSFLFCKFPYFLFFVFSIPSQIFLFTLYTPFIMYSNTVLSLINTIESIYIKSIQFLCSKHNIHSVCGLKVPKREIFDGDFFCINQA